MVLTWTAETSAFLNHKEELAALAALAAEEEEEDSGVAEVVVLAIETVAEEVSEDEDAADLVTEAGSEVAEAVVLEADEEEDVVATKQYGYTMPPVTGFMLSFYKCRRTSLVTNGLLFKPCFGVALGMMVNSLDDAQEHIKLCSSGEEQD